MEADVLEVLDQSRRSAPHHFEFVTIHQWNSVSPALTGVGSDLSRLLLIGLGAEGRLFV